MSDRWLPFRRRINQECQHTHAHDRDTQSVITPDECTTLCLRPAFQPRPSAAPNWPRARDRDIVTADAETKRARISLYEKRRDIVGVTANYLPVPRARHTITAHRGRSRIGEVR